MNGIFQEKKKIVRRKKKFQTFQRKLRHHKGIATNKTWNIILITVLM